RSGAAGRDEDGHLLANKISRQSWQPVELVVSPAVFDRDILAFDVTCVLQALHKSAHRLRRRYGAKKADHWSCTLLRARPERPRHRRTAEQRDELPASHSRPQGSKTRTASSRSRPGLGTGRGGCELRPIVLGWECRLWVPRPGQNRKNPESANVFRFAPEHLLGRLRRAVRNTHSER